MCNQEPAVLESVRRGRTDAWVADHLSSCASCAGALLVWAYLREEASGPGPQPLPAPDALWWKVQLERRRAAAERCLRPIALCQAAGAVAALVSLIALATLVDASGRLLGLVFALLLLWTAAAGALWLWARRS
jgi:hypothetical protein